MGSTFSKLEVKDPSNIKKLITESAESIEPGLKIIDSGGLLGHATIDLVGLDSKESLVLIALGLTADDGMLLRVLEAGSWCYEYPDTIRRLYPTARVQSGRAPRALFIAERLPDSFLRKIRHLGFPEIDCLEFRYLDVNGTSVIHFHPVERLRTPPAEPVIQPTGTGARNGTPAEVAAPVVAEAPAVTGTADSTEPLRSEWEEFLSQLGSELPVEASAGLAETPATEPEVLEAPEPTGHAEQVVQPNGNGARNGKPAQVAAPLGAEAPAVTPRADNLEAHREEWQALLSQLGTLHLPKNGELSREWREFLTKLLGAAQ